MNAMPDAQMSGDADTLGELLTSIDGRGYRSYQQLEGTHDLTSILDVIRTGELTH